MFLQMLPRVEMRSRLFAGSVALTFIGLIGIGVFAQNGWLPFVDGLTGAKTGRFGKPLPKKAGNGWNPINSMLPTTARGYRKAIFMRDRSLSLWKSRVALQARETKIDVDYFRLAMIFSLSIGIQF